MLLQDLPPSERPVALHRRGPIAILMLNRPEQNNAVDMAMREGLLEACASLAGEKGVRCVVVTGAGTEAFSVGMDITELAGLDPAGAKALSECALETHRALLALPMPSIAAINGACLGAGLEIALHCDMRIAAANAHFGLPGLNIGTVPGGSTLTRLISLIGQAPARALAMTGGIISAERAFLLGLVTNVVQPGEMDEAVTELAGHLASQSAQALKEIKQLLDLAASGGDAASEGPEAFARCFSEGDAPARLRALFSGFEPEGTVH